MENTTNPTIEKQTVQFDKLVIKTNSNIADVNDIINVLTIVTSSDKEANKFPESSKPATDYLVAAGYIEEVGSNGFRAVDVTKCNELSNYLSTSVENMIKAFTTPAVMFNSSNVENK